ncbi:hypothetical protein ACHAXN_004601 [Cyclotella atomus]
MISISLSWLSKLLISCILCTAATVEQQETNGVPLQQHDSRACPDDQECTASYEPPKYKASKHCLSSRPIIYSDTSLLQPYYDAGRSAQAFKPNAPVKHRVCETLNNKVNKIARNFLWRTNKPKAMPVTIRANIYTCSEILTGRNNLTIQVWQPRPDGTYSSLRDGVEEGDCRATIVKDEIETTSEQSNLLGSVEFETLTPGSPGLLGGLTPSTSSFGEFIYGPGKIHLLVSVDGHYPLLEELSMVELGKKLANNGDLGAGMHFFGPDLRPHVAVTRNKNDLFGGMEIQSAAVVDSKLEIEVDFFLIPMPEEAAERLEQTGVFCTMDRGLLGLSSFFKEPISLCFPSLLDYFAL